MTTIHLTRDMFCATPRLLVDAQGVSAWLFLPRSHAVPILGDGGSRKTVDSNHAKTLSTPTGCRGVRSFASRVAQADTITMTVINKFGQTIGNT